MLIYLPFRFELPDEGRFGTSVTMSPLGDLAAVTDTFGRISVVDLNYGIVVRQVSNSRNRTSY